MRSHGIPRQEVMTLLQEEKIDSLIGDLIRIMRVLTTLYQWWFRGWWRVFFYNSFVEIKFTYHVISH